MQGDPNCGYCFPEKFEGESNIGCRVANQDLLRPPKKEKPKLEFEGESWEQQFDEEFAPDGFLADDEEMVIPKLKSFIRSKLEEERLGAFHEGYMALTKDDELFEAGREQMKAQVRDALEKMAQICDCGTHGRPPHHLSVSGCPDTEANGYNRARKDLSDHLGL